MTTFLFAYFFYIIITTVIIIIIIITIINIMIIIIINIISVIIIIINITIIIVIIIIIIIITNHIHTVSLQFARVGSHAQRVRREVYSQLQWYLWGKLTQTAVVGGESDI